jgi:hypothetical protein
VRYGDLLAGSSDRVDQFMLNAFFAIGRSSDVFRLMASLHEGSD